MLFFQMVYGIAHAATLRIPEDYPHIRSALEVASAGDEILVNSDTYVPDTNSLEIMVDVAIRSTGGSALTTLPRIHAVGASLSLEGFTVDASLGTTEWVPALCSVTMYLVDTDLTATDLVLVGDGDAAPGFGRMGIYGSDARMTLSDVEATGFNCGAPILLRDESTMDLVDGAFHHNTGADDAGDAGGIEGVDSVATVRRTVFNSNATRGAAVQWEGGALTLLDSTFAENESADDASALMIGFAEVVVERTTFRDNVGNLTVGAVSDDGSPGRLTIRDSRFESNAGDFLAGDIVSLLLPVDIERTDFVNSVGLYAGSLLAWGSAFTITDSLFEYTGEGPQAGLAGAMMVTGRGSAVIENTVFEGQRSAWGGGAIYAGSFTGEGDDDLNTSALGSSLDIRGSTFRNTEGPEGGAIHFATGGRVRIADSLFDDTRAIRATGATALDDWGGYGGGLWMGPGTVLTVADSTVRSTYAPVSGGFLYSASGYWSPGDVDWYGSRILMSGIVASGTESAHGGFATLGWADDVRLTESDIRASTAAHLGGVLYAEEVDSLHVQCVRFCASEATTGSVAAIIGEGMDAPSRFVWSNNAFLSNAPSAVVPGGIAYDPVSTTVYAEGAGTEHHYEQNTWLANTATAGVVVVADAATVDFDANIVGSSAQGVDITADASSGDYNLLFDVATASNAEFTGFPGEHGVSGAPSFAAYTPGSCDSELFLLPGSPGRDQGRPTRMDVDGSPSDIGDLGGPDACVPDADGDGFYATEDCDDAAGGVNAWAEEIPYDGVDQDCDGVDECDIDRDGYDAEACGGDDCDDTDPRLNPGAFDAPGDGVDQDCAGGDAAPGEPGEVFGDTDGDGHASIASGGDDCNDADGAMYPGAIDIVADGIDQDCDGVDACVPDPVFWVQGGCSTLPGVGGHPWGLVGLVLALRRRARWAVATGAVSVATGCGIVPPDPNDCCDGNVVSLDDADGDGYPATNDCNDANDAIHPGVPVDPCNGVDDDCDTLIDEDGADVDGDAIPDCADSEICDGHDNDGDGAIDEDFGDVDGDGVADCVDTECRVERLAAGTVVADDTCRLDITVSNPWNVRKKWRWTGLAADPDTRHVWSIPLVAHFDDDDGDGNIGSALDIPEVVVLAADDAGTNVVVLLDGATGVERAVYAPTVPAGSTLQRRFLGDFGLSVADIDADGAPEIVLFEFVTGEGGMWGSYQVGVVALDTDGRMMWQSALPIRDGRATYMTADPQITFADVDADGLPEVIADNLVLDGATGRLRAELPSAPAYFYSAPVTGDLDGDGEQEIVYGTGIYSAYGETLVDWRGQTTVHNWPVIVERDGADGLPEVFAMGMGGVLNTRWYEWDGASYSSVGQVDPAVSERSAACVADFNGDGATDVAIGDGYLGVIRASTLTGEAPWAGTPLWSASVGEFVGEHAISAFDLDGDGAAEVLYGDGNEFTIFDGSTGTPRYTAAREYCCGVAYPVPADVDGDGRVEILVVENNYLTNSGAAGGVTLYEHDGEGWMPAHSYWGEFNHRPGQLGRHGEIPMEAPKPWLDYNLVRSDVSPLDAPDLRPVITEVCVSSCEAPGTAMVAVQLENVGSAEARAGTPLSLYTDDGTTRTLVATDVLDAPLPAGSTTASLVFELDPVAIAGNDLVVVAYDTGSGVIPSAADCDVSNDEAVWTNTICP